jgi:hypothetical protein
MKQDLKNKDLSMISERTMADMTNLVSCLEERLSHLEMRVSQMEMRHYPSSPARGEATGDQGLPTSANLIVAAVMFGGLILSVLYILSK